MVEIQCELLHDTSQIKEILTPCSDIILTISIHGKGEEAFYKEISHAWYQFPK